MTDLEVERRNPADLCPGTGTGGHLDLEALGPWLDAVGPVAFVDLETTGLVESRSAEIIEIGLLLLDPGEPTVRTVSSLIRPTRPIPALVSRLTGLVDEDVRSAPALRTLREAVATQLAGRVLVAHQADFERSFLRRDIDPALGSARYLDTQDLLALTHPDAPDLRLETFTRELLGREERHRALEDAIDAASVVSVIARGAARGAARYSKAARIVEYHLAGSPWAEVLGLGRQRRGLDLGGGSTRNSSFVEFARAAASDSTDRRVAESSSEDSRFLPIGPTDEAPVAFELDAILDALGDGERGARHFPGYRVREEQLELARDFFHVFQDGGIAKLEGGTGVGKSLAYLAVAIPFALRRGDDSGPGGPDSPDFEDSALDPDLHGIGDGRGGQRGAASEPVVLSTRTKVLQDQLLRKDIAAAARFLGYPDLRALSIKGRANYVCERRLSAALAEAEDPALLEEMRSDYAVLEACARIRPQGEIGTVPSALLRRHPRLRELLRASVATRADQCSREQCARERRCPFGAHRKALADAHLVVANHDLLLRWPPDYPSFSRVVMDEGHEVGNVAEEVYAKRVRPEDIGERLEELFGGSVRRAGQRYASRGLVARPDAKGDEAALRQNRRDLMLELIGLGRTMAEGADAFGGVELPIEAATRWPDAAALATHAAIRIEAIAAEAMRAGPARRMTEAGKDRDGLPTKPERDLASEEEAERSIAAHCEALLASAEGLRSAFESDSEGEDDLLGGNFVGAFEGLESPFDRWSLVLRPVAPGEAFREEFLQRVEGLAVVSATLFVGEDDYASLGEVGLDGADLEGAFSHAVGSPFPYDRAMRIVALEGSGELVEETAQTLATLALTLGGRTLGLFTSLARMRETADRLSALLEGEGIEVLLPRRASDDPIALVERFRKAKGGAVLLGARRFWQGIDVRGDDLQAVVIEKLPFDVPTELRARRDARLRAAGDNPFSRAALGRMLLHLKQMSGRLIRSETDRGLVVIVDARREKAYFRRLNEAFPEGVKIEIARRDTLPSIALELGLESDLRRGASEEAGH